MNPLEMLIQKYIYYQTRVSVDGNYFEFVILNPNHKNNIVINNSSGYENELTFYFSYHHAHFGTDFDALIAYIDSFLTESKGALQFFRNGERAFGRDVLLIGADLLSVDPLLKHFGYTPSYLVGFSYIIESWSGGSDLEAVIVEEGGSIICKRK